MSYFPYLSGHTPEPAFCLSCNTASPCVCGRNVHSFLPEPAESPDAPHLAQGHKADADKLRTDLLPPDVLEEVAAVLTFGANKYAARNWEKGLAYGRVTGAALRHVFAIMKGEDRDPETGLLHAAHAICCLMFLCGYQLRGMTQFDDRGL